MVYPVFSMIGQNGDLSVYRVSINSSQCFNSKLKRIEWIKRKTEW
jgi:hypothetical protein